MRYQNESCGICGLAFAPENNGVEEIVVCPDCGAPLHRACWVEHGGCPFAAQHGDDFLWQPQRAEPPPAAAFDPKHEAGVVCPVCGENCPREAAQCPNCNTHFAEYANRQRLQMEQQFQSRTAQVLQRPPQVFTVNNRQVQEGELIGPDPAETASGGGTSRVLVEEAALHIRAPRRSIEHYLGRFERNQRIGWNWAAFVFGPYWYFFRKLYKAGIAFAGVLLALHFALLVSPASANFQKRMDSAVTAIEVTSQAAMEAASNNDADAAMTASKNSLFILGQALRSSKGYLAANAAIFFGIRIAAALLADRLLRRKVWGDIAIAHEDSGGETPEQKLIRQRILVRRGGMSLLAPVIFYWANTYLPSLLMQIIERLTT